MDLTQDPDDFAYFLARAGREFKYARDNFLEHIHHWNKLSEIKYGKELMVELLPNKEGFAGSIFGKSFQVQISPITQGDAAGIESVITMPALNGGQIEIDRFFVSREGDVVSSLSQPRGVPDDQMSTNTLTGIIRAVLDAPIYTHCNNDNSVLN